MSDGREKPAERILRLAAYANHASAGFTLDDVTSVPGYETNAPRDDMGDLASGTPEWETLRKKVSRDQTDLAQAWGIHVDYNPVDAVYRIRPPFFTPEERRAIIAAAATVDVEGLDDGGLGEVGSAVDDHAAQVIVSVHPIVARLRDAIATRTPVQFGLNGRVRHVAPWALGTWRNRWYLVGRDFDADADRVFRLDRIEANGERTVESWGAAGSYVIPESFDAEAAFDLDPNSWGHDPCRTTRVRVEADHVAAFIGEFGGIIVDRDESSATIELDVRHYESFRNRILAFRGRAIVVSPPDMAALTVDHLVAIAGAE